MHPMPEDDEATVKGVGPANLKSMQTFMATFERQLMRSATSTDEETD